MKQKASTSKQDFKNSSFSVFPFIGAFSLTQLTEFPNNFLVVLVPIIIIQAVLIVFYLGKINKKHAPPEQTTEIPIKTATQPQAPPAVVEPKPKPKPKIKGIPVRRGEVEGETVKFSSMKGFFKKHWVTVKEIPLAEIVTVESSGNELTITWKDQTAAFVLKKKGVSFMALRDQIRGLLEEQQKTRELNLRAAIRKGDLTAAINASLGVVDASFDVLMGLQVKPIDWARLEGSVDGLGQGVNFAGQMLAPLTLDFSKMTEAVKAQVPKDASRETFGVLKSVYGYFEGLTVGNNEEKDPVFKGANDAMVAYYMLNDLLLAKIIGEKDIEKETSALEALLSELANETNVKVNLEELKGSLSRFGVDEEVESVIADVRETFRVQLKQF